MRLTTLLLVMLTVTACHRNGETAVPLPNNRLEGAYTFTINKPPTYMDGSFVVADTQVFLYADGSCAPANAPRASDDMRAAWFNCRRTDDGAFLQLRISQVDPVNKSRWYRRMQVPDIVDRCTQFNTRGVCTQVLRARGLKWVDVYGNMVVTRGLPDAEDSTRVPDARGSRRLRVRCDTIPGSPACPPGPRGGA